MAKSLLTRFVKMPSLQRRHSYRIHLAERRLMTN
jgi:hypothetical protein